MFTFLHILLTYCVLQLETLLYMPQSCWSLLFSCIICRLISSKQIHKEDIRDWKREIPHLMCEMQKYLPLVFFNAQEHYLIHQVEEIQKVWTCTHKVNVDGWEALEITQGFGQTKSTYKGFYCRGIYDISNHGLYYSK